MYAAGDILIVGLNGPPGDANDGPGDVVINAFDLQNPAKPIQLFAGGGMRVLAGRNLTVQAGASLEAGTTIYLKSDYQGDLSGNPIAGPTDFQATGTTLAVEGIVIAPAITLEGGDGPDTVITGNASVLNAAYPWTLATFPAKLGSFPANPSQASQITILGDDGDDTVSVWGAVTAKEIDIFGGNGDDIVTLNPVNGSGWSLAITGQVNIWGGTGQDQITFNALNTLDLAHTFIPNTTGPTVDRGLRLCRGSNRRR
jgi:hypothetical protein